MFLQIALFILSFLIVGCTSYCLWWYITIPINLPPGPIGLPLVGCFPWVKSWEAHETLTRWSKIYGPLFSFYQGAKLIVVLADPQVIDEALVKQSDVFSGRPILTGMRPKTMKPKHGINSAEGPLWKEQRRFVVNTLKDFGLGRPILEPKIMEEAGFLLEEIAATDGQPFDPRPLISNAVCNVICSMVFGHRFPLNSELRDQLNLLHYRSSRSKVNTLSAQSIFPWYQSYYPPGKRKFRRFVEEGEEIMRFLQKEIDSCKESFDIDSEPTSIVHAFFKAQTAGVGEYFTDIQLRSVTFDLFLAGTDTTVTTLCWATYYMAKHPGIQNSVRDEILSVLGSRWPSSEDRNRLPLVEAALMEVHRLASLAPMSVMHRTTCDTRLRGYSIPQWTYVLPLLWAVHRDERFFPNANRFDPTRFLTMDDEGGKFKLKKGLPLMPFSVGKRACLGEPLAKMELFIYFTVMMQHFHFTFATDEDEKAHERSTVAFLRSPGAFRICATSIQ